LDRPAERRLRELGSIQWELLPKTSLMTTPIPWSASTRWYPAARLSRLQVKGYCTGQNFPIRQNSGPARWVLFDGPAHYSLLTFKPGSARLRSHRRMCPVPKHNIEPLAYNDYHRSQILMQYSQHVDIVIVTGAGVLVNITIATVSCLQIGYTYHTISLWKTYIYYMYICTKCILFSSLTAHIVEIYKAKIANYSSHKAAYPNALRNVDFRRWVLQQCASVELSLKQ